MPMQDPEMKKVKSLEDLTDDQQGFGKLAFGICMMTGSAASMVVLCDPKGEVSVSMMVKQGCPHLPEIATALEGVAKQLRSPVVETMNHAMPPGAAAH